MVFPIVIYGCESWTIKKAEHKKNWNVWIVVLEKALEIPLDCKGNQPRIFIGKNDAKPEAPIFWLPSVKSQLIGKAPNAGKDWGQEEKQVTEDEMLAWNHQLDGHEFE